MENKFKQFMDETIALNKAMKTALIEFVKNNGGLIRTDFIRGEDKQHLPTMFGVLMQNIVSPNHEYPIIAVAVDEDDDLMILPDYTEGFTNLGNMPKEEILAMDEWISFGEGLICENVTLYNMCDTIGSYV